MGEFHAIRWEQISVPAGTFEALRIFHYGWGYTAEYWYAPAVRHIVRLEGMRGYVEELVSFHPAPPRQPDKEQEVRR